MDPSKKVPDLNCEVKDLLLEVADLKQEVPDLRSGGIPQFNSCLQLTKSLPAFVKKTKTMTKNNRLNYCMHCSLRTVLCKRLVRSKVAFLSRDRLRTTNRRRKPQE